MDRLREILKATDPVLYHALEMSWTIAEGEWVPTLRMEQESHGGLPHLQSVERCMDRLADAWKPAWSRQHTSPFGFNGLELYMALCAALFHDIGRGRPKATHHGADSSDILNRHWAQLGIINGQVAFELGHICAFHTSDEPWTRPDAVKIHPWGTVHTQAIAALLVLADELDTAYTRAVPSYMKDPDLTIDDREKQRKIPLDLVQRLGTETFTKGLYREFISDVGLDPDSRVIKTVLFADRLIGKAKPAPDVTPSTPGAPGWLAKVTRDMAEWKGPLPTFTPEDYFFSFIDHCRLTDDSGLLDLLQEQFGNAVNFSRSNLIRKFRPPQTGARPWSAVDANVVYNLYLWDRMPIRAGHTPLWSDQSDLAALDDTINLIRDTIKSVDGRLKDDRRPTLNPEDMQHASMFMLRVACGLARQQLEAAFLKDEKRLGASHTQTHLDALAVHFHGLAGATVGRESLLAGKLPDKGTAHDTPQEDLQFLTDLDESPEYSTFRKSQAEISALYRTLNNYGTARDAHRFLVLLLRHLAHVDLAVVAPTTGLTYWQALSDAASVHGVRGWSTWPVRDFHRNLVSAFHVYLVLIRRLWVFGDALDYRYAAAGSVEARFRNPPADASGGDGRIPTGLTRLVNPPVRAGRVAAGATQGAPGGVDAPAGARIGHHPGGTEVSSIRTGVDSREDFIKELQNHRAACRPVSGHQAIGAEDFQLAVRLIFMQWLSNDVTTKNKALARIREGLAKLGIHFDAWMIEYNNHLYDAEWRLRLEPILQPKHIVQVAERMFALRSGLHRPDDALSWDTLAAALRDPHSERVKTAAVRFGNLLRIYSNLPKSDDRILVNAGDRSDLHYGHMLLADLKQDHAGRPKSEWTLETSHSDWRLSPNDARGSGLPPSTYLDNLVTSFLSRIHQGD